MARVIPQTFPLRIMQGLYLFHQPCNSTQLSESFQLVDIGPPNKPNKVKSSLKLLKNGKETTTTLTILVLKRLVRKVVDVRDRIQFPFSFIHHIKRRRFAIFKRAVRHVLNTKVTYEKVLGQLQLGERRTKKRWRKQKSDPALAKNGNTVGRVAYITSIRELAFETFIANNGEPKSSKCRLNDKADKSIFSSRIAECAVLDGIGRTKKISSITL